MARANSSNANRYKGVDIDSDGDGQVNDAETLQGNKPSDIGNTIDESTIVEDSNGDLSSGFTTSNKKIQTLNVSVGGGNSINEAGLEVLTSKFNLGLGFIERVNVDIRRANNFEIRVRKVSDNTLLETVNFTGIADTEMTIDVNYLIPKNTDVFVEIVDLDGTAGIYKPSSNNTNTLFKTHDTITNQWSSDVNPVIEVKAIK